MPGIWQPVFASESLPETFAFRAPINVDHDGVDEDHDMDADDEDAGSGAEFRVGLLSSHAAYRRRHGWSRQSPFDADTTTTY